MPRPCWPYSHLCSCYHVISPITDSPTQLDTTSYLHLLQLAWREACAYGAGYVGGPTMAATTDRRQALQVTVVDINQVRIDA
jgi:hypothetical protein